MMKPVVGQKLWFVGARLGNFKHLNGEVTVTAVGKKWMEVQGEFHGRVDVTALVADGKGYASPGRCFLSRLEWLNQEGPELAWEALRLGMLGSRTTAPPGESPACPGRQAAWHRRPTAGRNG